jgi:hypothetical protein
MGMGNRLVALAFAMPAVVGAAACSGPIGESADTGEQGALEGQGRKLSEEEVASLVRQVGFPENMVGTMVCTVKWESGFYDRATNQNHNGTTDYGLFQINSIHIGGTNGCPGNADALFDVMTNSQCALAIYNMQGINAWYGYKAHKSECDSYAAPQSATVSLPVPLGAPQPQGQQPPVVNPNPVGTPGYVPPDPNLGYGFGQDPQYPSYPNPNGNPGAGYPTPVGGGSGCFWPPFQQTVPERGCVQDVEGSNNWIQCHTSQWYRGVNFSSAMGPFGMCSGFYVLGN